MAFIENPKVGDEVVLLKKWVGTKGSFGKYTYFTVTAVTEENEKILYALVDECGHEIDNVDIIDICPKEMYEAEQGRIIFREKILASVDIALLIAVIALVISIWFGDTPLVPTILS